MPEALIDANILVRHLTGQPPALARLSVEIMQAAEQSRLSLVVTPLTLAECVWVLETVYKIAVGGAIAWIVSPPDHTAATTGSLTWHCPRRCKRSSRTRSRRRLRPSIGSSNGRVGRARGGRRVS
jgi:predicted nucleic acid-binding protein